MAKQRKREPRENEGRPSKINKFIKAFQTIADNPNDNEKMSIIYLTDSELVFLVNQSLDNVDDRIHPGTFKRWKAQNIGEDVEGEDPLDHVGKQFCALYKKALLQMKASLFDKMTKKTEPQWQKWAWIIERKFDEWNIRHKNEHKGIPETSTKVIINKHYDGEKD